MTSAAKGAALIVHLWGAWTGATNDPQRRFAGTVVTSDLPAIKAGEKVQVQYQGSPTRVPGSQDHGHYLLTAGHHDWPLMRFGGHASAGGTHPDDTREADWVAEVLPTALGAASGTAPDQATDRGD